MCCTFALCVLCVYLKTYTVVFCLILYCVLLFYVCYCFMFIMVCQGATDAN